jgi:cation transporter-like permease
MTYFIPSFSTAIPSVFINQMFLSVFSDEKVVGKIHRNLTTKFFCWCSICICQIFSGETLQNKEEKVVMYEGGKALFPMLKTMSF